MSGSEQKGEVMRDIIKIAYLIEYLIGDATKEDKVAVLKLAVRNREVTQDEAIDLAIEYLSRL